MGDVTNDGRADIVGFKMDNGTYVAKGERNSTISAPTNWTSSFIDCNKLDYYISKFYLIILLNSFYV